MRPRTRGRGRDHARWDVRRPLAGSDEVKVEPGRGRARACAHRSPLWHEARDCAHEWRHHQVIVDSTPTCPDLEPDRELCECERERHDRPGCRAWRRCRRNDGSVRGWSDASSVGAKRGAVARRRRAMPRRRGGGEADGLHRLTGRRRRREERHPRRGTGENGSGRDDGGRADGRLHSGAIGLDGDSRDVHRHRDGARNERRGPQHDRRRRRRRAAPGGEGCGVRSDGPRMRLGRPGHRCAQDRQRERAADHGDHPHQEPSHRAALRHWVMEPTLRDIPPRRVVANPEPRIRPAPAARARRSAPAATSPGCRDRP